MTGVSDRPSSSLSDSLSPSEWRRTASRLLLRALSLDLYTLRSAPVATTRFSSGESSISCFGGLSSDISTSLRSWNWGWGNAFVGEKAGGGAHGCEWDVWGVGDWKRKGVLRLVPKLGVC